MDKEHKFDVCRQPEEHGNILFAFNLMFTVLSHHQYAMLLFFNKTQLTSRSQIMFLFKLNENRRICNWRRYSILLICFRYNIFLWRIFRHLYISSVVQCVTNVPAHSQTHSNVLQHFFSLSFAPYFVLENASLLKREFFLTFNGYRCSNQFFKAPNNQLETSLWMVLLSIHDTILCFRNFQQSQCSLNTLYPFVLDFFLFVLDFFHVFFEKVVFLFTKENYLILFIRHQKNLSNSTELITEFLSFTRFFFRFFGFLFSRQTMTTDSQLQLIGFKLHN